jgi:hypothetical protein
VTFVDLSHDVVRAIVDVLRVKGAAPVLVDASGIFAVFSAAEGKVDCALMCIRDGKPCPVELTVHKRAYDMWRVRSIALLQALIEKEV